MFLFGELIKSPFIHLLESYSSANHLTLHPSIPLASYFRADHLTFHPSIPLASYFRADHLILHPFGELFSCRPFNSPSFGEFFCADHITLHPSIVLESYLFAVHCFGELFFCRPSLGRVIFVLTIQLAYSSTHLASYFCVVHPLGRVISVPTI